jgi:hypothetical protein
MNLSLLLRRSDVPSSAPAVTQGIQSWRYGEFSRRVAATAAYLRERLGAQPGDRIGIAMQNCPGTLQLMYDCWHGGLCAGPINAKLHPREFALLDHSGARLLRFGSLYQHPPGMGRRRALRDRRGLIERMAGSRRCRTATPTTRLTVHQGTPAAGRHADAAAAVCIRHTRLFATSTLDASVICTPPCRLRTYSLRVARPRPRHHASESFAPPTYSTPSAPNVWFFGAPSLV